MRKKEKNHSQPLSKHKLAFFYRKLLVKEAIHDFSLTHVNHINQFQESILSLFRGNKETRYGAIATSLGITGLAIFLDDLTTFVGLSRGYVETNPIYPYSLLVTPMFYIIFLVSLEGIRLKLVPQERNRHFILLMIIVALLAFKPFVNNILVLMGMF